MTGEIAEHWSTMFRALATSVPRAACPSLVLGSLIRFPGLSGGYGASEWRAEPANENQDTAPRGIK